MGDNKTNLLVNETDDMDVAGDSIPAMDHETNLQLILNELLLAVGVLGLLLNLFTLILTVFR